MSRQAMNTNVKTKDDHHDEHRDFILFLHNEGYSQEEIEEHYVAKFSEGATLSAEDQELIQDTLANLEG
jgi:hypothetical protein